MKLERKRPFWRHFEKLGLIIAITFSVLLTMIYLLLLYQSTESIPIILYNYVLDILSELIPALLIVSASLGIFRYFENVRKDDERELLLTEIADAMSGGESIAEFGLIQIHPAFPSQRFKEELQNASSVRVLTTWISDTFRDIDVWASSFKRKGCKIEILLLDPNTQFAKQRGIDLGLGESFVVTSIMNSISHIKNLVRNHDIDVNNKNFVLKKYQALPSVYFLICDDVAFVGYFWHSNRATHAPIYEYHRITSTNFGAMLHKEFERLRDSSSTMDIFPSAFAKSQKNQT